MSAVPLSDSSDSESETEGSIRTKPTAGSSKAPFIDTGIPPDAFRSHLAPAAARESLGLVSNRVLGHAGFDGTYSYRSEDERALTGRPSQVRMRPRWEFSRMSLQSTSSTSVGPYASTLTAMAPRCQPR